MALDTSRLSIDFEILRGSTNCKFLKIADLSNWGPAALSPSYIDITLPGNSIAVSLPFQKGVINLFQSNNLGLSNVNDPASLANLPDGAYKVCVKVCMGTDLSGAPLYEEVCKYYLQDCQIRCKLNKKIIAVDLTCESCRRDYINNVLDIQLFLDAAQAQIEFCNVNKAMEFYRRAAEELERFNEPTQGRSKYSNSCPECWPGDNMY